MSTLEEPLPRVEPGPGQDSLDLDQHLTVVVPFLPIDVTAPSWDLLAFSGKGTRCVKCGIASESIPANYHNQVATYAPCYLLMMNDHAKYAQIGFPEHIDRRCLTCGYQWVEALAIPGAGD